MAEASKTIEMKVPRDKLLTVIRDFESYADFVDGVHSVKVLAKDSKKTRVQFTIEMLGKEINYTLDHKEDNDGLSWTMVESNIFKANEGAWVIKDLGGGKSEVTYKLALEFKIYVPGMVLSGLVKSSLPKMLSQFENRAKEV